MEVCFITHDIAHIGGQERVLITVANMLSEHNINVTILITSNKKEDFNTAYSLNSEVKMVYDRKIGRGKFSDLAYKILRIWNKKICKINNYNLLEKIYFPNKERKAYEKFFHKHHFDVIIGLTVRPAGMLTLIKTNSRKVAWLHSTFERYFEKKNDFQWHQIDLYKKLLPKLDDVIVLTDYDKKEYSRHFDISPIRIYNPLPYQCNNRKNNLDNTVLFVGRLHYDIKGLDYLIDIIAILDKLIDNFSIIVVGDGSGKNIFIDNAKKRGIFNRIKMLGEQTDIKKYYQNAKVCVVPSRVEGFGMVIIEAFESGVPVVAFENAGPSELIDDGETGFLIKKFNTIDFADKVSKLLENDILRQQMSEKAKKKANEFSKENICKQWLSFLLGKGNGDIK